MSEQDSTERMVRILEEMRDNQKIQATSAQLVGAGRKVMAIVLPLIVVLIVYLSWLLFARPWR